MGMTNDSETMTSLLDMLRYQLGVITLKYLGNNSGHLLLYN